VIGGEGSRPRDLSLPEPGAFAIVGFECASRSETFSRRAGTRALPDLQPCNAVSHLIKQRSHLQ
jgi:hypothetical protein